MGTFIGTLEVLRLPQHKHILLLQYVELFFSTDISNQIIYCRRFKMIGVVFMAMVLSFLRLTLTKLFPNSNRTQLHLLTCHRRTV